MKGKNGKSSAMRGGGLARKGAGVALKGGGIARKGTGSNATPGSKKMAMGGMSGKALPPRLGGSRGAPGMPRPMGTKGADMDRRPRPGMSGPMTRPGVPSGMLAGGMGAMGNLPMPGRAAMKKGGSVKKKGK